MGKPLWKYGQKTPSTYQNVRNLSFTIYASIGTIKLKIQKEILEYGLVFHIR